MDCQVSALANELLTERPFHAKTLLTNHLKPAGKRAGIDGLGWHTFRHTYRAPLADLGETLDVQKELMRHSDVAMTLEYGKFSAKRADRLRTANSKVVQLVAAASS
jgi:integrase